jgi:putative nucleotidyltransferase with HDIG domain
VKKVLFVDDEPRVLEGLQRMLHPLRAEWETAFAGSGPRALELLDEAPFDVVVSDMRMPGMDGSQLLARVKALYPHIVRVVLSGYSDDGMSLRCVSPAHQYLAKPCDADVLRSAIDRACALREKMADAPLRKLVAEIGTLPSLPSLYLEIIEEVKSPDASLQKVAKIVSKDVAMTAKILQLVNSAFFSLPHRVASPQQAVSILGLKTISALVLSYAAFSQYSGKRLRGFPLEALMSHCVATGALAKVIARSVEADSQTIDDAFLAGLLHDIGQLVFAAHLGEPYERAVAQARAGKVFVCEAEQQAFGASHGEVGAYLLGLWGLPDPIVEAVFHHHTPAACSHRKFSPLSAVHIADALDREGRTDGALAPPLDEAYVGSLSMTPLLDGWRASLTAAAAAKDGP